MFDYLLAVSIQLLLQPHYRLITSHAFHLQALINVPKMCSNILELIYNPFFTYHVALLNSIVRQEVVKTLASV